ncbi:MAG: helicase [Candidatus Hydrogenedentes bacterium]|nr:helicase [Candidatus Hydrogenedentota bacterium]
MPRLDTFHVKIRTGAQGPKQPPQYSINGFPLDFDECTGGAGTGETLELRGEPRSFPHSLLLQGPREGCWEIADMEVTYHCANETPYTVRLGMVSLDHRSDLNLWYPRPAKVIDV